MSSDNGAAAPSCKAATSIEFWVIVPVLSVAMTVTAPKFSMTERPLTKNPFEAILLAPNAKASVTVGSSPSGIIATRTPSENKNAFHKSDPPAPAMTIKLTAMAKEINATTLEMCAISF